MGCLYNIPPIRTKDHAYVDVLSESINNPIRFLVGWFAVTTTLVPPASLLVSYWMIGAYFMAAKRFAEYRDFERGDGVSTAVRYRKSFAGYTSERLLVSIMFYASTAMLFFGAFIVRYRLELVLSFPLVAIFMAMYLRLSFRPDSPVEHPEALYRERALMVVLVADGGGDDGAAVRRPALPRRGVRAERLSRFRVRDRDDPGERDSHAAAILTRLARTPTTYRTGPRPGSPAPGERGRKPTFFVAHDRSQRHRGSRDPAAARARPRPLRRRGQRLGWRARRAAARHRVGWQRRGPDLDAIASATEAISPALDAPDLARQLPDRYALEVSSPGLERPLAPPGALPRRGRRAGVGEA